MKQMTIVAGRGKKKKSVKLFIPRSMTQQEVKRWFNAALFDGALMGIPSGTPLKTQTLSAITQGGGAINRLGDAIFVHEVVFRVMIVPDATITWSVANLAWVLDREPAVGLPNWNIVFNTIGGAGAGCYDVAMPAYDTRFRFKYLERMTVPCSWHAAVWNGAAVVASVLPIVATVRVPIKKKVMYDATNAVYAGVELLLYGWSSGGNAPLLTTSVEVFFSDA